MMCVFADNGRRQDPALQRAMERVPPTSMQDNQVERASEACVQDARDDRQTERLSRSRIGRQEHENGLRGIARVTPSEGDTMLQSDGVRPLRIRRPAGVSGSVTQSLIAQIIVAVAGDQRLGLEAVECLGMGVFIKGGEVGFEGHVGLQFREVDGLFECHGVILSVDRRWTDRGKDRGHESGLHPARGGMKWSTPGAGLL